MRNANCRTWSMGRKSKIMENEKHTLQDENMARNTEKREKCEMYTVGPGFW